MAKAVLEAASVKAEEDVLLSAAARLFRERGFEGSSLRQIARAAGMLPGSLYYRYRTKEALLLALMRRGVEGMTTAIRRAVEGEIDPVERLRLGLRAHLRALLLGDDAAYVLLYEWRSLGAEARREMIRLRDRYDAFWEGMLYEAAGCGRLRAGADLKLVRLLGFGAMNWTTQWYSSQGGRTPDEIADVFWGCMAFGLVNEASRPENVDQAMRALGALEGPPRGRTA